MGKTITSYYGSIKKPNNLSSYFINLFFLGFYYSLYRYPLQINSSSTSPTYSDTPLFLQIAKYILYVGMLYITVLKCLHFRKIVNSKVKAYSLDLYATVYLLTLPITFYIIYRDIYYIQSGIFWSLLLPIFISQLTYITIQRLKRKIDTFIYIAIIVELIQVYLFLRYGRLPALAYAETLSVRFGSIWDDPNGFAIFVSFMIPYVFYREYKSTWIKPLIIISLMIILVLTQSFTAVFSFIVAIFIGLWLIRGRKSNYGLLSFIIILAITLATLLMVVIYSDGFQIYMGSVKGGSISAHLDSAFSAIKNANLAQVLGISPNGSYGESGILNLLLNYGLIYVLIYLKISISAIRRLIQKGKGNPENRNIYYALAFFMVSYLLGTVNLPLENVFPLNLFFILSIAISYTMTSEGTV